MNLGKSPWRGLPDNPYTECKCYAGKESKKSMITKPNPQEKVQSILDARAPVAEFLSGIGKIEAFNDFTKDDICGLIRAAHDGVQESLKRQLARDFDDEIPF